MGKYIVTNGQNIYDISLHLYGSIEGFVDLMMNNTNLSLSDTLHAGDELVYTDNFIINSDVFAYLQTNKITPANGEQHVYYKSSDKTRVLEAYLENNKTAVEFSISGAGHIDIDWGDNTPIQSISLSDPYKPITHIFDNQIADRRKIVIYGEDDLKIKKVNFSKLTASRIYLLRPIYVERFILENNTLPIDFISLLNGVFDINLSYISTGDVTPLLNCKQLMRLDLSGANIKQNVIDSYLIGLVKFYHERRNCSITLTTAPSGEYREPQRDSNQSYIISSGMEAIWVLTHELSWNEAGSWSFTINDTIYSFEKENKQ